jgi:hypothetical protein
LAPKDSALHLTPRERNEPTSKVALTNFREAKKNLPIGYEIRKSIEIVNSFSGMLPSGLERKDARCHILANHNLSHV